MFIVFYKAFWNNPSLLVLGTRRVSLVFETRRARGGAAAAFVMPLHWILILSIASCTCIARMGRPARAEKEHMQGVRRVEHLPAQSDKEQVQDVHSRSGRVHASGSRRALRHTHTSFCHCQCLLPPAWIFRSEHRHTNLSIDTQI